MIIYHSSIDYEITMHSKKEEDEKEQPFFALGKVDNTRSHRKTVCAANHECHMWQKKIGGKSSGSLLINSSTWHIILQSEFQHVMYLAHTCSSMSALNTSKLLCVTIAILL